MKKLFLSAVSSLAFAGVAVAADSTEFGVLYVPSTARETIVAVPWLESGTGTDVEKNAIKVADLVLTSGLTAAVSGVYTGDQLLFYPGSGTTYQCWVLVEDAQGVKHWEGGDVVSISGVSETPVENSATLERGQAIILRRDRDKITSGFYIMGKPSDASGEVPLTLASKTAPAAYTMIAPPFVTATNINTAMGWSGIDGETDSLQLSDGTTLGWKNTKGTWGKMEYNNDKGKWEWNDSKLVPAGTGFWFITTATSGTKKAVWPKPQD